MTARIARGCPPLRSTTPSSSERPFAAMLRPSMMRSLTRYTWWCLVRRQSTLIAPAVDGPDPRLNSLETMVPSGSSRLPMTLAATEDRDGSGLRHAGLHGSYVRILAGSDVSGQLPPHASARISVGATPLGRRTEMSIAIGGISVPDSKLAREIAKLVRDTESPLLFHHSSRVFYWGALTGVRRGVTFDAELLYAGAMFHDVG